MLLEKIANELRNYLPNGKAVVDSYATKVLASFRFVPFVSVFSLLDIEYLRNITDSLRFDVDRGRPFCRSLMTLNRFDRPPAPKNGGILH